MTYAFVSWPEFTAEPLSRSSAVQQVLAGPQKMEPGKTYVAKLPGRSRPSFIRRKVQPPNLRLGFSAGTEKLVVPYAPPRSRSVEAAPQEIRVVSTPAPPTYAIAPPPQQLQLEHTGVQQSTTAPPQTVEFVHAAPSHVPASLVLEQQQPSSTVTAQVVRHHARRHDIMLQHTCASCGKFRSPSYHHRHPLAPDEIPRLGICRKCMKVQTSSDESTEDGNRSRSRSRSRSREARRHKRSAKRTKHGERHRRSSSEERAPSVEEVVRVTRRTESRGSRDRRRSESRRRRHSPSSSEGQAQIQVSYLSAKKSKVEPPAERVHVVERIRYVEPPEHGRSRSDSRAREVYEEDNEYVPVHRPTHQRRPIKYISYRQDDDRHIIGERRPEPTRTFSPRRPDTHLIQHEEAYHRELGHRYRPRRISYEHIREPSRSSRDSFEHGYHADIPSHPPSRSVRVLGVHNRGSEDVVQDSWESDSADVGPPRVMFVSAEHARRHSPVERHISEDIEPIRRRRRRRIRDFDDLILDRRSELSHVTGKFKKSSQPYLPPLVTNNSDLTQSTPSHHHVATATCASPPHHPPNGVPSHESDTYHHLHRSIAYATTTSTTRSNVSACPLRSALHLPVDAHRLVLEASPAAAVCRHSLRRITGLLRGTGRRKVRVIDP